MKKKKEELKDYISEAVKLQKEKLFKLKFITEMLFYISHTVTGHLRSDMGLYGINQEDFSKAMNVLHNIISVGENTVHRKLAAFVDIDPKVNKMLRESTLKWFEKEDHEIMSSYLGKDSYYDEDEKKFRKQVLAALKKDFKY